MGIVAFIKSPHETLNIQLGLPKTTRHRLRFIGKQKAQERGQYNGRPTGMLLDFERKFYSDLTCTHISLPSCSLSFPQYREQRDGLNFCCLSRGTRYLIRCTIHLGSVQSKVRRHSCPRNVNLIRHNDFLRQLVLELTELLRHFQHEPATRYYKVTRQIAKRRTCWVFQYYGKPWLCSLCVWLI